MNHRRKLVVVAALVAMCTSIFIGVGSAAASLPPPISLSQSSGQAGTTVTVTLPAPCTVPAGDAPDPYTVEVLINAVNEFEDPGYDPTYYAGTPGVPITQVTLPIPAALMPGTYVVSATCGYGPGPFGDAYFVVTSATQLPSLTVAPNSLGQGQVVDVTGDCAAIVGQPTAYFFVAIASATDPGNIVASDDVSGPGPTITVPITIPSTAPPGSYFITATCDDYTSVAQFAESPLTITGTAAATTLATSLTNSLGQSGTTVTSGTNVGVTDDAVLSGTNVATAGGTVTYSVFSDSACTVYVGSGGTVQVTDGQVPASSPVSFPSLGTYYWQAYYGGDGQNAPVTGTCGSEVEDVNTTLTTLLSGGGQSGTSITVTAGDPVTDAATLSGPGSSTTSGTVSYSFYFDSGCTQPVSNPGNPSSVTATDGSIPSSAPIDLGGGIYYWQAEFIDDAGKVAASTCGSEIETVNTNLTTTLTGGGQSGTSISVPEGTTVTDTAKFIGPAASNASGTVEYFAYSDSNCFDPVGTFGTVTVTNGAIPPSDPATFSTPGTYYWLTYYSGDSNYPITYADCGSEVVTVTGNTTASTSVSTSLSGGDQTGASISVPSGTAVSDTATLSGTNAATAGGTVTYNVFSDSNCTQQLAGAEDQVAVTDGGVPASSPVTLAAGTYYWQASYSGDSTNAPSTSTCGSEVETVTAVTSPVTVTTSLSGGGQTGASVSVPSGTAVSDTATLSGTNTSSAAGTVTYTVYSNDTCSTSAGNGGTMTVSGGVVPASDPVTLDTPGTYYWQASYSGDSTNAASKSTCGSEVETVTSTTTSTSVSTSLSGGDQTGASISVPSGTAVSDTATLSGTNAATAGGTVTYNVFSDSNCTQQLAGAEDQVAVTDGGVPASSPVTLAAGTYYWQASYSGDSTNAPSTSTCGSEVETVTAVTSPVTVTTSLSGGGQTGVSICGAVRHRRERHGHPVGDQHVQCRRNRDLHGVLQRHLLHVGRQWRDHDRIRRGGAGFGPGDARHARYLLLAGLLLGGLDQRRLQKHVRQRGGDGDIDDDVDIGLDLAVGWRPDRCLHLGAVRHRRERHGHPVGDQHVQCRRNRHLHGVLQRHLLHVGRQWRDHDRIRRGGAGFVPGDARHARYLLLAGLLLGGLDQRRLQQHLRQRGGDGDRSDDDVDIGLDLAVDTGQLPGPVGIRVAMVVPAGAHSS